MAIMGFLVHTLQEEVAAVEEKINAMPEMTTYGIHQGQYVVVVAEAISVSNSSSISPWTKVKTHSTTA